jgi:hypothetical protein
VRFLRSGSSSKPADESSAAPTTGPETVRVGGKGRPTPKRRDAEGRRRGPAPPPPKTQREASKLARANRPAKEDRRAAATERREGMARGDDKFLMPRDRGPVKGYVRDLVDSRPHLMGLFMPLAIVVVLSLLVPIREVQSYLSLFSLIALTAMIIEGILLGVTTTRKVRERFPAEKVGGLGTGWYAFTRATQLRRLRIPKPRVQRGAKV